MNAIEARTNRVQWAAALNSGVYPQGKHALHKYHQDGGLQTYCCLGVACVLAVRAGVIPAPASPTPCPCGCNAAHIAYGERNPQSGVLPAEVVEWLDLTDARGLVRGTGETLAGLNDAGVTFGRIAELIMTGQIVTRHDEPDWADKILEGPVF